MKKILSVSPCMKRSNRIWGVCCLLVVFSVQDFAVNAHRSIWTWSAWNELSRQWNADRLSAHQPVVCRVEPVREYRDLLICCHGV